MKEWNVNDLVTYIDGKESSKTSTGPMHLKHANNAASAGDVSTTQLSVELRDRRALIVTQRVTSQDVVRSQGTRSRRQAKRQLQ